VKGGPSECKVVVSYAPNLDGPIDVGFEIEGGRRLRRGSDSRTKQCGGSGCGGGGEGSGGLSNSRSLNSQLTYLPYA